MTSAKNVKRLKGKRGTTHENLTAKANSRRVYMARIESAVKPPSVETLETVAKASRST